MCTHAHTHTRETRCQAHARAHTRHGGGQVWILGGEERVGLARREVRRRDRERLARCVRGQEGDWDERDTRDSALGSRKRLRLSESISGRQAGGKAGPDRHRTRLRSGLTERLVNVTVTRGWLGYRIMRASCIMGSVLDTLIHRTRTPTHTRLAARTASVLLAPPPCRPFFRLSSRFSPSI